MRTNTVKQLLRAGKPAYGTWLSLGDQLASRMLAKLGFDWLTVDLEHAAIDWKQAAATLGAIADAGCVPLARVPEGNVRDIKRALDAGAWGIIAPMVETVEQAKAIVAAAKYPPAGNRSLGGVAGALNFAASQDEYFAKANDEVLVVLQTESPQGIANAEQIYRVEGVDAIFVGPIDLRARLKSASGGPASDADFEAAIDQIIAAGRAAKTPTGIHAMSVEAAQLRAQQGMQFIAVASDVRFMVSAAMTAIAALKLDSREPATLGY